MRQAITRRRFLQAGAMAGAGVALFRPAAVETNLVGRKVGEVSRSGGELAFETKPWKVRTFEIE